MGIFARLLGTGSSAIKAPPATIIQMPPGTHNVMRKERQEKRLFRLQQNIPRLEHRLKHDRSLEGRTDLQLTIQLRIKQQKAEAAMIKAYLEQF